MRVSTKIVLPTSGGVSRHVRTSRLAGADRHLSPRRGMGLGSASCGSHGLRYCWLSFLQTLQRVSLLREEVHYAATF